MNKKHNSAYFALLIAVILGILTIVVSAQNAVSSDNKSTRTSKAENNSLQNYINISFPNGNGQKMFSDFSAEDKAGLFKLHLALQFIKRPHLSSEQKNVILEGISMISPESYRENKAKSKQAAKSLEQKALAAFSKQEGLEIFASIGGGKEEVEMLKKYQEIISLPTMVERKTKFVSSSATDKSNFWKIKMLIHLAENSALDKDRQDFILEMVDFLTPEAYTFSNDSNEWKKLDESLQKITHRAVELFGKEKGAKLFASCGEIPQEESQNLKPRCDCSRSSDWCVVYGCYSTYCDGESSGCGTFGLYACNGRCYSA